MPATEKHKIILELQQVGHDYGYQKVLRNLDLQLIPGEFLCLQGPNGAGKSTLLKCLTARGGPDHGKLHYKESLLNNLDDYNHYLGQIAYLGHATGLLLDLSALENLQYIAGRYNRRPDPRATLEEWLGRVGLFGRRDDTVRTFSRGMQQRLALARVFMVQPALLYLDEPLTGLDRSGIALLQSLLEDYKQLGGTALYVTHDEAPFSELSDRYIFFNKGQLLADVRRDRYSAQARQHIHNLLYND